MDGNPNPADLRVIKTKRNIEESFVQLLLEKDFSQIRVQDIIEKALINRKTFYRYYRDKYHLAECVIIEFFGNMEELFREKEAALARNGSALELASSAYQLLSGERDRILALWNVHTGEVDFYSLLQNLLQDSYRQQIESAPNAQIMSDEDEEMQLFLTSTLTLQTMHYLLESGREYSPASLKSALQNACAFLTAGLD